MKISLTLLALLQLAVMTAQTTKTPIYGHRGCRGNFTIFLNWK
jgi:hypothetical protein